MDRDNLRNLSTSLIDLGEAIGQNEQQLSNIVNFTQTLTRIENRLTAIQTTVDILRGDINQIRVDIPIGILQSEERSMIRASNSYLHTADSMIHWIPVIFFIYKNVLY